MQSAPQEPSSEARLCGRGIRSTQAGPGTEEADSSASKEQQTAAVLVPGGWGNTTDRLMAPAQTE